MLKGTHSRFRWMTGDPLHSRAAMHTALQCKYTQPWSFARLCSENGNLATLRLLWFFHGYVLRHAMARFAIAHFVWSIGIVHAFEKECNFEHNLKFAVQIYIAGLCATSRAVCFQHGCLQFRRAVCLCMAIESGNPPFTITAHSRNMNQYWPRSMLPHGSLGNNEF